MASQIARENQTRADARTIMSKINPDYNPKTMVVHHIDCNPFNNDPSNLMAMTPSEHLKIHAKLRRMEKGTDGETKTVTIRLPYDLWIAARRLEERGLVSSISDAVIKGLIIQVKQAEKEVER